MQHHFHAVVWIDHSQARVFHLGLSGLDEVVLHPRLLTRHIHHKANSIGSGHVHESDVFLQEVLDAVSDAGELLILDRRARRSNSPNISANITRKSATE
jgi:hypothetical protein